MPYSDFSVLLEHSLQPPPWNTVWPWLPSAASSGLCWTTLTSCFLFKPSYSPLAVKPPPRPPWAPQLAHPAQPHSKPLRFRTRFSHIRGSNCISLVDGDVSWQTHPWHFQTKLVPSSQKEHYINFLLLLRELSDEWLKATQICSLTVLVIRI